MSSLERIARLYGTTAAELEPLGAFESDVYAFHGPHGPSILKMIAPAHRTVAQVQAEVDWLLALDEAGVAVGVPVAAETGELVEQAVGPECVLVAFRRAQGGRLEPEGWTEQRLESWGALLGQLQTHSRNWQPPGPRRTRLIESGYLHRLEELVADDDAFLDRTRRLLGRSLPLLGEGPDSGLIHADLHHGNLLFHEEKWTAIDFDDSGYGAYIFDLTMPLYYALRALKGIGAEQAAKRFLPPFLRGFRAHAVEPDGGAEAMCQILQLRQAELVLAIRARRLEVELSPELNGLEASLRRKVTADEPLLEPGFLHSLLG